MTARRPGLSHAPQGIIEAELNTKLRDTLIGVVCEEADFGAEFGFAGGWTDGGTPRKKLDIRDNTHYITQGLPIGRLTIYSSMQPVHMLTSPYAPDLQVLGGNVDIISSTLRRSLAVVETGGEG